MDETKSVKLSLNEYKLIRAYFHILKLKKTGDKMAGRERDPEILRTEAQELIRRAKRIEERRFRQVGQYVYDHYKEDFANLDLDKLKAEIKNIFDGKKKSKA
jgi:hypothetical protein